MWVCNWEEQDKCKWIKWLNNNRVSFMSMQFSEAKRLKRGLRTYGKPRSCRVG